MARLRQGFERIRRNRLGILTDFAPNRDFWAYAEQEAVGAVRRFRDEVVHRERPRYREQAGFGRTTLWDQGSFTITLPPPGVPDEGAPSLNEHRQAVGRGVEESLKYAESLWAHAKRWLRTIDVWITLLPNRTVEVNTRFLHGTQTQRFPRANRDPGPFLEPQ